MKMTSLQEKPFDVNLYVFYRAWLNDKISRFGYQHRGFALHYRDWDTKECVPNGGKSWSLPESDPFLKNLSRKIPTVTKLFQKLHPGEKYYLTNIKARNVDPEAIRQWSSDLWLFPYYTNRSMVPFDARPGGPVADAYPNVERRVSSNTGSQASSAQSTRAEYSSWSLFMLVGVVTVFVAILLVVVFAVVFFKTRRSA